ncbi:hypothetical protein LALCM10_40074 [Dellaglioa algida]|nr:hypothetical protein LALCM10_40074 [Dellaglioa algida]
MYIMYNNHPRLYSTLVIHDGNTFIQPYSAQSFLYVPAVLYHQRLL